MIVHYIEWLGNTQLSQFIQNVLWIIPAVQSIHIIAVAVVLSSTGMVALRFFGLAGAKESVAVVAERYISRLWWCLLVLLVTGTILVIGEPFRELINPAFQVKMALVACAVVGMRWFQLSVRRNPAAWDRLAGETRWKAAAVGTMTVFFMIAIAGRWIAYTVGSTVIGN